MQITALLTTAIAALATAAPLKYHGVSLHVNTYPLGPGQPETVSPAPIQINRLTSLHHIKASKLTFDEGVHIHVDINKVECQAYKDVNGWQPLSGRFNVDEPAILGQQPVAVGSVLCYITKN